MCGDSPQKPRRLAMLWAVVAWANFLSAKGHEVAVVSPNEYPAFLNWLPGQETIVKYSVSPDRALQHIAEAGVIFTLDFNDLKRIDGLEAPWQQQQRQR